VNYRVPDLSSYRAAYDNADSWIYRYRVVDDTTAGLRILDPDGDGTLQVTVGGTWNKSTGSIANSPQAPQTVALTRVSTLPGTGTATSAGQDSEPDAWYYLSRDNTTDKTTLVIGIGRWLVKHYGDIRANDKTTTLYGQQILIRYKAASPRRRYATATPCRTPTASSTPTVPTWWRPATSPRPPR
jgi:hypothetical protein